MSFAELIPLPDPRDPPSRRITVSLYEADNVTKVMDLTTDTGRDWTDVIDDLGTANLTVPLFVPAEEVDGIVADMAQNPEWAALTRGRVLRFALDGTDRFPAVIRPRRQTSVSSTHDQAGLTRSVSCYGLLSEWDRAVLPPSQGAELFAGGDTRHFGWMSKEADIADLESPVILREVFRAGYPHPSPWIDAFGAVFSAASHRYFIFDQTTLTEKSYSVHLAAADQVAVWLNGVPMGQGKLPPESSWLKTLHGGAKLPTGTHRWGFDVQGLVGQPDPRWTATCFTVNDATTGVMNGDTIDWRTGYITGTTPYPWKASALAEGPTVKRIIRRVLEQVQTEQGLLTDWVIDGDDDYLDSNGNEMDRIGHLPFQIGVSLAKGFLLPLAKAWCDLAVDVAGKKLYVYRFQGRGSFHLSPDTVPVFSDAVFSPVDGRIPNILSLTHEERIR